jgi:type I restriction enzyme S subunit
VSEKWGDVAIEEVGDEVTVGYVGPMASEYVDRGVPFLRSMNIEPLLINKRDLKFITPEFHQRIRKSRLTPGDVVIVRTGKPGSCSVVPPWFEDGNCSDLVIVRCGERINNHFLAYYINTAATHHIASHLVGAVQQHFNVGAARTLRISLPPLSQQKRIAHILGTLDDKIELNRRMNATLESMARALFQSWFVDFDPVRRNAARLQNQPSPQPSPNGRGRSAAEGESASGFDSLFPESFQDSELGEVPKGWKVYPLSAKIQLLSGGTPKTYEEAYWGGDIPWYSVRDAPIETDVWVIQTDKSVTSCGIENSAAKVFPERTTIISARGTVGKLALTGVPMAMNQSCYGIRGAAGYGDYYTHYLIREATARLQQNAHGSVFDTITTKTFEALDCIFPDPDTTIEFDKAVAPLLLKILANLQESRTLATVRDTLLPKLLCGELEFWSVDGFKNCG